VLDYVRHGNALTIKNRPNGEEDKKEEEDGMIKCFLIPLRAVEQTIRITFELCLLEL